MNQGFTLIELLVVVVIIGVLSAIALPQYQTAVERSRATEALTLMNAIQTSAERYHAQHETWPTTAGQLDVDIPQRATCATSVPAGFGGKNFCIGFSGTDTGAFVITADRVNSEGTATPHAYQLATSVRAENNGTYTATRSCEPKTGDSDATDTCNAIAGGADKISDF
ncbi:MAG: prepilin-type N-terminal cleavage/methylation domain-containing protein [Elusimicrobiaceae bacterium]|nr:prepilin-type N-terminal cleavage/methylation domain-containing protein [Elusimicrobiaceae bacterium]